MHWADLSTYEEDEHRFANVRRVGWLSRGYPFPQGDVPPRFVDALRKLTVHSRVNQARGFHYCEFCDEEEVLVTDEGSRALLGSAEIWVPAGSDTTYAAPDLLLHYVQAHRYAPPTEFVVAVMSLDLGSFDADALWREHVGRREESST